MPKDDPLHTALATQQQQLNKSLSACLKAAGTALSEIGNLELGHGLWESARATLLIARDLSAATRTILALAEVELILGRHKESVRLLSTTHADSPLTTHVAFVLWLAERSAETRNNLQQRYAELPVNQRAVFDSTKTLNGWMYYTVLDWCIA